MSARAYDEWAENCPMALDQIVVAGTKRTRKKSSKYADDDDDDDDAEPSKIAATINKRKTPEKSNEGGTDDEAPTKQPRATAPTSPHPATPAPITTTSPSETNTPPDAILPEAVNLDVERDEYSGDCNVTKEQLFEYGRNIAGTTEATAKEPPEKPSKVDDSHPFMKIVSLIPMLLPP
mmetsp:Transcript_4248/g.6336  ORF Transcript_4248/g.6336 Transcript_4248/m.6336 type:complete len:178 (+) Transcript_4248:84-617(+)